MGLWNKAKDAVDKAKEEYKEAQYSEEYTEEEAIAAASEMKHDIDANKLRKEAVNSAPLDVIKQEECIKFYIAGADFDIDDNDQGSNSELIVTEQRSIILSTSATLTNNKYTISHREVIGVGTSKRVNTQIRIQASGGQEYKISAVFSDPDVAADCTDYIRNRSENARQEENNEESAIEKIKQLSELREQDVISDNEFEQKKSELMDKI